MAAKWEYKIIMRNRAVEGAAFGGLKMGDWEVTEDGKSIGKAVDMNAKCTGWGNDGWELVSLAPRSTFPGQAGTLAGITTEETWVFKRSK